MVQNMRLGTLFSTLAAAGVAALLSVGSASALTAPLCSTLTSSQTYANFGAGCMVTSGGKAGQDFFSNVNPIVERLFADEGISILQTGSFSPGGGTGEEFEANDSNVIDNRNGFAATLTSPKTVNFTALPTGTIFISLKQGNGFHLFPVLNPLNFSLTHTLNGGDISHVSTFAGVIPLPAAGWLLISVFGGLGAANHLRRRRAA